MASIGPSIGVLSLVVFAVKGVIDFCGKQKKKNLEEQIKVMQIHGKNNHLEGVILDERSKRNINIQTEHVQE